MKASKYLDRISAKYDWSDYRIAKELGLTQQAISAVRKKENHTFSDETSLQIAALLGIEPLGVISDMGYQRARTPATKKFWRGVGVTLTVCFIALGSLTGINNNSWGNAIVDKLNLNNRIYTNAIDPNMYYAQLVKFLDATIALILNTFRTSGDLREALA